MKRCIVFLLLVALPIRAVLALSSIGCSMMSMQPVTVQPDRAPCPLHAFDVAVAMAAAGGGEVVPNDHPAACPSCATACCAALAPVVSALGGRATVAEHVPAVLTSSFIDAVGHSLERPPRNS